MANGTGRQGEPVEAAPSMPAPDAALARFDRFIGTWDVRGRTVGSAVDDVGGQISFSRLPGGFFVQQRTRIEFTRFAAEGVEIIGYDPATDSFPSTVYSSLVGTPLPYRWRLDGDDVTIVAEALHATFHGRWRGDGQEFSGGWRGDPGHENDPGNIAYDISGIRARG